MIDRVVDGQADFTWTSGGRGTMTQSSAGPAVDVRSGETVQVDLGGPGRPLVGQVVLSGPDEARAGGPVTGVHVANANGWLEIKPAQMPIPADFRTWDAQKRQPTRSSGTAPRRGEPTCAPGGTTCSPSGRRPIPDRRRRTGLL